MRNLSYFLFVLGILISITGYIISNATEKVWVGRILFPKYIKAKEALNKLESNKYIFKGEDGFAEIEQILRMQLKSVPQNKGKENIIDNAEIMKIGMPMGKSALVAGKTLHLLGVQMVYQGNDIFLDDFDIEVVRSGAAALSNTRLTRLNALIFWTGILLMIASKIVDTLLEK